MININYFFEETEEIVLPENFEIWLQEIAQKHQTKFDITYIFCNDETILTINQEYLNHNYFTDIITFDLSDNRKELIESDIYISLDTVKSNSQKENDSFANELARVMAHGIFHLLGFNDKTKTEKAKMRQLENEAILKII